MRYAVILLACLGLTVSVFRAIGVVEGQLGDERPVPELSRFDRGGEILLARILGAERGSDAYAELDGELRAFFRKFGEHPAVTLTHVVPAGLMIVLALLQFSNRIRARAIAWHRWSGRLVVVLAVPIGLTGLFFGLFLPFGGALEASAVGLFGAWFLWSLGRGFVAIRRGDRDTHRRWMVRMFAVALGVSVVRLVGFPFLMLTREGPALWFGHSVWVGFAISAGAAELWIRLGRPDRGRPFERAAR